MDQKQGIFISHITEEKATAFLLKDVLQKHLGLSVPIFVSSDYESIPGGDVWYQTIVDGLKGSAVVIVLLSPDSLDRPWINFEAGVGIGADSAVIPVVVHGLERRDVGHPFASLHIRSLQTVGDADALLKDIHNKLGVALMKALIPVDGLVAHATQRVVVGGWVGVEWQNNFLAVAGPLEKLPTIDRQNYIESMSAALVQGGFMTRMTRRDLVGQAIGTGLNRVYITDRKTFRAEIGVLDVVLTAKKKDRA